MNYMAGCAKRGTIFHRVRTRFQLPLCIKQLTAVNEYLQDTKQPQWLFPVPAFSLTSVSDWTKPAVASFLLAACKVSHHSDS